MAARSKKNGNPGRTTLAAVGDVNARLRAAQALALLIQGYTYEAIAATVGYRDKAVAYNAVRRELHRYTAPLIENALALELARLDHYLVICEQRIAKGDLWAIDRALKVGEARRKLLGLNIADRPHESAQEAQQMIVIGVPQEVYDAV